MPSYLYKAINENGDLFKGQLTAFDEFDLEKRLQEKGLAFISCKVNKDASVSNLFGGNSVKPRMVIEFYYRLAQTMNMGLPMLTSLEDDSMLMPSKAMRKIVQETRVAVESGKSLHESMSRFHKVFGKLDMNIIRMGEETGKLPKCLNDLALFLEWKEETKSTIKRATIYPVFILIVILGVIGVWVGYVLPQISAMLSGMGIALPEITKIILIISLFLQNFWAYLLGGFVLVIFAMFLYHRTPHGSINIHHYLLKIPILGDILANAAYARLCHHFATMHETGMNVKSIFDILQDNALGNRYLEDKLRLAYGLIQQGQPIADSFRSCGGFPPILLGAVKNGELTGTLDSSFNRLGDYFDREVKRAVHVMTNTFEPMAIMVLGGVFGLIVLSILLPLYDVIGQIGKAY
jgi:type II secretory pathway component PulF